jgi:hypothetical protein
MGIGRKRFFLKKEAKTSATALPPGAPCIIRVRHQ